MDIWLVLLLANLVLLLAVLFILFFIPRAKANHFNPARDIKKIKEQIV